MLHLPDSRQFLRVLENQSPAQPTLFEPFLHDTLAEQLIWRRGPHLFAAPEAYTDTMISLRERTQADVVCLDARRFPENALPVILHTAEQLLPEGAKAVLLCDSPAAVREAEASPAVCAVGGFGDAEPHLLPFIRMDQTPDKAVSEGASGWFAKENAESVWEQYHDRIAVCGGLGADWCSDAEPMAIYRRAEALCTRTENRGFLLGSGGTVRPDSYLSLISLLGIYIRMLS